jgi:hypothetical protein
MAAGGPYAAIDAFLTEHRLCRPELDDPDVNPMLVALWCSCGARITVKAASGVGAREGDMIRGRRASCIW